MRVSWFLAGWLRLRLLEFLDHDRRRVGNFLAGLNENAFADEFGDHEAQGLVGVLILGKVALAGREDIDDFAQQHVETIAFARADGDHLREIVVARERLNERQKLAFADEIDFGEHQKDGAVELADEREEEFVFVGLGSRLLPLMTAYGQSLLGLPGLGNETGAPAGRPELDAARGVHQHKDEIARFQSLVDLLQHAAAKLRAGLVHAGRIDENDLRGRMPALSCGDFNDAGDAVARGLRLGRDNGHLFAGEGVEQGAFAHVWAAENGDKSGFQRVLCS